MKNRKRKVDPVGQLALVERVERDEIAGLLEATGLAAEIKVGMFRIVFDRMSIAEELLAKQWPRKVGEPRPAFKLLCCTHPVRASERLYEAHAAELIARMATFSPWTKERAWSLAEFGAISTLTRAEAVGLLCETSLRHPLQHRDAILYESLFEELFGPIPGAEPYTHNASTLAEIKAMREIQLGHVSPERAKSVREIRADWDEDRARAGAAAP